MRANLEMRMENDKKPRLVVSVSKDQLKQIIRQCVASTSWFSYW